MGGFAMKKLTYFFILLAVWLLTNRGYSQYIQPEDLTVIAKNWIQIITDRYGSWGGNEAAYPGHFEEFRHKGKLIGYYCDVQPIGFMVFSLRRELAPVKASSDRSNMNPMDEDGIASVIKTCMLRIIDTIESVFGNIASVSLASMDQITEIDYRPAWLFIESYQPGSLEKMPDYRGNYQEGQVLLTSSWHQFPPYNNNCPHMDCTNTTNGRTLVGCVATAGAQIMRYWSWPPWGVGSPYNDPYDWANMLDVVTTSSPEAQQAAVAELNAEVGQAVGMDYGCEESGATTADMVGVYVNHFRYNSGCTYNYRSNFNADLWFMLIKLNMNLNRPIQYRIPGHSIVCDGWRETGTPVLKEYHMNYGWRNTGSNTWYALDALPGGNPSEEYMVFNIVPATAMGTSLLGVYNPDITFPYRYFDQDATGDLAIFTPGQNLQVLHGIKITGSGPTGNYIKFYGDSGYFTRIFSNGDISSGIIIGKSGSGGIRLSNNGGIKLH
jgi:hypothetical protein